MTQKKFKIAAIQTKPRCGDVVQNLYHAYKSICAASGEGAKIVCLPELFDTGYDLPWVKKHAAKTAARTIGCLSQFSKDLGIYIIAGIANRRKNKLYNSSFLFSPEGKVENIYDKNYLFKAAPQREHKYFCAGKTVSITATKYGKIGSVVCNDIRYPSLFVKMSLSGARIIFISSAWGTKRLTHWQTFLRARALEDQVYIVGANQTGKSGEITMAGHSAIIDFDGNTLAEKKNGEGIIIAEVDYTSLEKRRRELPTFNGLHHKAWV